MKQLWQPAPAEHPFPSVADWAKGMERLREEFGGTSGPFPERLVRETEQLFAELLPTMESSVVLHGDLHHYNILAATREPWVAIDPKGVVGEPAYEVGALLRNPLPDLYSWPDLDRITARRIAQLSEELGFDRQRLRAWGLAQAVLSAWWSYEDHGIVDEQVLVLAEILSAMKV
jgi:streptomycin 6-kinase